MDLNSTSVTLGCIFAVLIVIVLIAEFSKQSKAASVHPEGHTKLRNIYFVGVLIFKFSDWMMGPYFYKVYESKGLSREDIVGVFLTGFISAMIFGTFIGSLADKIGRKKGCQLCGFMFALSCLSTHSSNYHILLMGRFLGGIGASLLHSSFEAWMVCEHKKRALPEASRRDILGLVMLGDSFSAIIAGLGAQVARSYAEFTGPFDTSCISLIIGIGVVSVFWTENYGSQTATATSNLQSAWSLVRNSSLMTLLGCGVSSFESAMYIFVFQWASALQDAATSEGRGEVALGLVFACYMAAIMVGSRYFVKMSSITTPQVFLPPAVFAAAVALLISVCVTKFYVLLACFIFFEFVCGVYFPAIGSLRAEIIPESLRATVMNLYRVPLNAFVICVLLLSRYTSQKVILMCGVLLLLISYKCLHAIKVHRIPSSTAQLSPILKRSQQK